MPTHPLNLSIEITCLEDVAKYRNIILEHKNLFNIASLAREFGVGRGVIYRILRSDRDTISRKKTVKRLDPYKDLIIYSLLKYTPDNMPISKIHKILNDLNLFDVSYDTFIRNINLDEELLKIRTDSDFRNTYNIDEYEAICESKYNLKELMKKSSKQNNTKQKNKTK